MSVGPGGIVDPERQMTSTRSGLGARSCLIPPMRSPSTRTLPRSTCAGAAPSTIGRRVRSGGALSVGLRRGPRELSWMSRNMQARAMMRARCYVVKSCTAKGRAAVRALVKERAEPGLSMADIPTPVIGADDVLVRVRRTSICGTDLHIWSWDRWSAQTIRVPMVIGHEFMGEVAGLGAHTAGLLMGQRVAVEGHLPWTCRNCRAGRRHLCHNVMSIGVNRDGCSLTTWLSQPPTCSRSRISWPTTSRLCSTCRERSS